MPSLFSVIIKPKHARSNLDFVAKDMLVRIITMQKIEEEILKSSNTDRPHVRKKVGEDWQDPQKVIPIPY